MPGHHPSSNSLNVLNYPASIGNQAAQGEHYMMLDSYESMNALHSGETKKSSIALYIPPNAVKTGFSANYDGMDGGALKAASGKGVSNILKGDFGNLSFGGAAAGSAAYLESKAAKLVDKGGFISAGAGLAVNNHIALVYKGPTEFRTHDFTFQFWPKSTKEAGIIKEIIRDFQNGMLPRMAGSAVGGAGFNVNSRKLSAPYFKSPRHWTIKFFTKDGENPNLFKIKRSVITSMQINHDPEGVVSFHADGYPVHTALTLQFKEIEFVVSGDEVGAEFDQQVDTLAENQSQAASAWATKDTDEALAKSGRIKGQSGR